MGARRDTPDRASLFADGVFAVIITILVLELKLPSAATFKALLPLWPTGLAYGVSYLFIAIVWINHHHVFRFADVATPRLLWFNFMHLFCVSLIPFSTDWIAESKLATAPVALYAAIFVFVNITYLALCWEAVDHPSHEDVSQRVRRMLRMRSFITIGVFASAALIALKWPVIAIVLICLCLIGYLRPDVPEVGRTDPASASIAKPLPDDAYAFYGASGLLRSPLGATTQYGSHSLLEAECPYWNPLCTPGSTLMSGLHKLGFLTHTGARTASLSVDSDETYSTRRRHGDGCCSSPRRNSRWPSAVLPRGR